MAKPTKPEREAPAQETPADAPPAESKVKVRYVNGPYECYFGAIGRHVTMGQILEVVPEMADKLIDGRQFERYEPEPAASTESPG